MPKEPKKKRSHQDGVPTELIRDEDKSLKDWGQCGIHVLVAPEVRRRVLVAAPTVCPDN